MVAAAGFEPATLEESRAGSGMILRNPAMTPRVAPSREGRERVLLGGVQMKQAAHPRDFHHLLDRGIGVADLDSAAVHLHQLGRHEDRPETRAADVLEAV